ncbi:unnamed protein product [Colias eurytheme]|nr:unnamed protein product [Colias eurytheme]
MSNIDNLDDFELSFIDLQHIDELEKELTQSNCPLLDFQCESECDDDEVILRGRRIRNRRLYVIDSDDEDESSELQVTSTIDKVTDLWCEPAAAIDIKPVLSVVVKLLNTIRSRGLMHRQFQAFLKSTESEFSDVLYHTKVGWLSCGNAFERVWNLRKEIQDFLTVQGKWDDFKIMSDENWFADFAFFTDLLSHLNKLNTKLQGKNQFLDEL